MSESAIRTAVITGHHAFDLPALTRLFRELPGVDVYIQHLDDFAADLGKVRDWYDVLVFYNFHQETPGPAEADPWWGKGQRAALERLGETKQGIVLLHHSLLAYRRWAHWDALAGFGERGFGYHPDQHLTVQVADRDHPITQGLNSWDMVDETYTVGGPSSKCDVLLTTNHASSSPALAWTHTVGKARVFCYASGHDAYAFEDPNFQTVLARGIAWGAHRL